MASYTLTKNYAEIEITNDVAKAGIILRPFQMATISQKVFARKIGNAGAFIF